MGRAIAGLLNLCHEKLRITTIDTTNTWIFQLVQLEETSLIIGSVYFRPSHDIAILLDLLEITLEQITSTHPDAPIVIGGDFNARVGETGDVDPAIIEATCLSPTRTSYDRLTTPRGALLSELMMSHGFVLLNGRTPGDAPAYTGNRGNSVVDLVWIDVPHAHLVSSLSVAYTPHLSDHHPVEIELLFTQPLPTENRETNFRRQCRLVWDSAKADDYAILLQNANFQPGPASHTVSIEDWNDLLTGRIRDAAHKLQMISKPMPLVSTRCDKPWFDQDCRKAKKLLSKSVREFKKHPLSNEHNANYLSAKREYKNLVSTKKDNYELKIQNCFANVFNSNEFWGVYRRFNRKILSNNQIPLTQWELFYKNIYPPRILDNTLFFGVYDRLLDKPVTLEELKNALKKIKSGKAPGPDEIPSDFYKHLPENCLDSLLSLFNKIITGEATPIDWSSANLLLFHKKGDRLDPSNYRGIALCNVISKIFTLIMYFRLAEWSENLNLFGET